MKFRIKYPNITLFILSIALAIVLHLTGVFEILFSDLGSFGYVGAFIAGLLFPITFTAPIATAALFYIGGNYDILSSALLATFGALVGDLVIFTFIKDRTLSEIHEIRKQYRIEHRNHDHHRRHKALVDLFQSKPFHAIALFLGGLLIISPFPDELGVAILASYKVGIKKFIPLSFILNGLGILIILLMGCACSFIFVSQAFGM
jgi:hypothetical protein